LKHRKIRYSLLASIFLFLLPAAARSQPDSNFHSPEWLQLSFEQRTRYERLTNPFRSVEPDAERLLPLRTRLKLEIGDVKGSVRFLIEFQDSRAYLDEDDIFLVPAHINKHDLLQAQIQFNSGNFLGKGLESRLAVGRFTMDLGKRRLVARNGMRNTTNSFDGVSWSLARDSDWKIQTFFSSPVIIDSEKLDSSSSDRFFWGVYYENMQLKHFRTEAYYLGLHEDDHTLTRRQHSTAGFRIYKNQFRGEFDFEAESAWQLGKTCSQDHFSHFQHGELGYSFNATWTPRLSFQYDYAGGDGNPEDDKSGRFNPYFGARSFEYTPTGIYGPIYRSNLNSPGGRFVFSPTQKLQITASHRAFWLARAKDAWVGSGYQDPTGRSGKTIGQSFEANIKWRPKDFFLLEFGYARFFKGTYLDRMPGSSGTKDSNFFFIATEIEAQLFR
jgi:hypothetical protein